MFWRKTEKRIGQMLIEAEVITEGQLNKALEKQKENGGRVGKILVDMGLLSEDELTRYVAEQYRIPHVSLDSYAPNKQIFSIVPVDICKTYGVIPIDIIDDILTVGISDVPNEETFRRVEELTGFKIQVMLVTANDFNQYMSLLDNLTAEMGKQSEMADYVKNRLYEGIERRKNPRFGAALRVKYEFRDEYHIDSSINVSKGGLLIKSKCPVPPNSHIAIKMELPTTHRDVIIISKVVWIRPAPEKGCYLVGMSFISIDSNDSARLDGYLASLSEEGQ